MHKNEKIEMLDGCVCSLITVEKNLKPILNKKNPRTHEVFPLLQKARLLLDEEIRKLGGKI